jgi:hypothetical protein
MGLCVTKNYFDHYLSQMNWIDLRKKLKKILQFFKLKTNNKSEEKDEEINDNKDKETVFTIKVC